jgi:arylsulfatase A-like enzyme
MAGPWDAPYELRAQYADEEDPPPPQFTAVPNRHLPENFDPDELLGITHAYAGQVSLVDSCLGIFLDAFRENPRASQTLLAVLGARGFPLGEHRRVGPCDEPLYEEMIHVPFFLRMPDGFGAMERNLALVRTGDLGPTLCEWLGVAPSISSGARSVLPLVRGEQSELRDHVLLESLTDRALRTTAWHFRQLKEEGSSLELYAKPSDRWEVNEVADRVPEVAAAFREKLAMLTEQPATANEPLPEILVTEID